MMFVYSGSVRVEAFTPEILRAWAFVPLITVYKSPRDYPGKWVARLFDMNRPTPVMAMADTYEELRKAISPGMVRMARRPDDDPVIEEVWI